MFIVEGVVVEAIYHACAALQALLEAVLVGSHKQAAREGTPTQEHSSDPRCASTAPIRGLF